ncbi:MAG: hypothetical protein UR68_C0017G0013 [Candidatus Roizmanbacteria bacterium GW2011_GWA2_35_19]|uniref:Uncharacterized protein n=2 Tax=Candidatus Roizmaniibacteriota TaxID=1752723 RepID=A0A0G0EYU1_9BACT|nr:MAG: hypothetical protein UR63_C0003G0013 [Candidatus Roizmanbacteria bacterium GW2011_GWC2_35_12]KKP72337.1 MAG: hypothetical protein UR68_C0017G0013 [Candidatus Roizmanbacteria bacterium GW2011_GWA2_35_19]
MVKNKFGFTIIELLISISIILIFSGISLPYYNKYSQEIKLQNEVKKLISVIELAKKKAISSDLYQSCDNFSGYKIIINADNYSFRFGCAGVYQNVQTYNFPTNISVISGTGNFTFKPLGIGTNIAIGAIRLKNSSLNQCLEISITTNGILETGNIDSCL